MYFACQFFAFCVADYMEGFVVTREQRELMVRVLKKEITLEEAISMLSKKYK